MFCAYDGQCPLTGCLVPEAVEAAHLHGRDWRKGHNEARDGILLRRDVHALYDANLIRILPTGEVEVDKAVEVEYGHLSEVRVLFRS